MPRTKKVVVWILIVLLFGTVFLRWSEREPGAGEQANIDAVTYIVDVLSAGETDQLPNLIRHLPSNSPVKTTAIHLLARTNHDTIQNNEDLRRLLISYLMVWVVNETAHSCQGSFPNTSMPPWKIRLLLRVSDSSDAWDLGYLDAKTTSSIKSVLQDVKVFAAKHGYRPPM